MLRTPNPRNNRAQHPFDPDRPRFEPGQCPWGQSRDPGRDLARVSDPAGLGVRRHRCALRARAGAVLRRVWPVGVGRGGGDHGQPDRPGHGCAGALADPRRRRSRRGRVDRCGGSDGQPARSVCFRAVPVAVACGDGERNRARRSRRGADPGVPRGLQHRPGAPVRQHPLPHRAHSGSGGAVRHAGRAPCRGGGGAGGADSRLVDRWRRRGLSDRALRADQRLCGGRGRPLDAAREEGDSTREDDGAAGQRSRRDRDGWSVGGRHRRAASLRPGGSAAAGARANDPVGVAGVRPHHGAGPRRGQSLPALFRVTGRLPREWGTIDVRPSGRCGRGR